MRDMILAFIVGAILGGFTPTGCLNERNKANASDHELFMIRSELQKIRVCECSR